MEFAEYLAKEIRFFFKEDIIFVKYSTWTLNYK